MNNDYWRISMTVKKEIMLFRFDNEMNALTQYNELQGHNVKITLYPPKTGPVWPYWS